MDENEKYFTYRRIMFAQGEDATELLDMLDEKGEDVTADYICENYDMGDATEEFDSPSSGSSDNVMELAYGVRLTWNNRLGYIGLERFFPIDSVVDTIKRINNGLQGTVVDVRGYTVFVATPVSQRGNVQTGYKYRIENGCVHFRKRRRKIMDDMTYFAKRMH